MQILSFFLIRCIDIHVPMTAIQIIKNDQSIRMKDCLFFVLFKNLIII